MVLLKINERGCKAMPHSSLQRLEPFKQLLSLCVCMDHSGRGGGWGGEVFRCVIAVSTVSEEKKERTEGFK